MCISGLDNYQTWRACLAMLEEHHIPWLAIAFGVSLFVSPEIAWVVRRYWYPKRKNIVASGTFGPATSTAIINKAPSVSSSPSVWARIKGWITDKKPLKDVPDLQRCRDELIKYSGYDFPAEITTREIGESNALSVHLERACFVLDEQGISHPEFDDKDIVIANYSEWIRFLSKLLARDDACRGKQQ